MVKIATWNINGLRSGWEKFQEFIKNEKPDIICLQEIKIDGPKLNGDHKNLAGYSAFWCYADKPGYSGVAIYSKLDPQSVVEGTGVAEFDQEGRAITLRFKKFAISNWYFPHSGRELKRLDFKLRFNKTFYHFARSDEMAKKTIFCGDFNVAHEEIDIARPKDNANNAGFTSAEREWMDKFLAAGLADAYREIHPQKQEFTWWSQRAGVRERNVGWRIDYFLAARALEKFVKNCTILTQVRGSDHCPVTLELEV